MSLNQFLATSYTAYHTTQNAVNFLRENGYKQLTFNTPWKLSRGGKYFITLNGSSVIAFNIGTKDVFSVAISHTDSPSFKLKGNGTVISEKLCRLNTEKYGGGILYSYFDRPLKIAGRLFVQTENGVEEKFVASDYNVVIPSLCIHHNTAVNEGVALSAQNDTLAVCGIGSVNVYQTLCKSNNVLDGDLYVVPATQPFTAGTNGELLCSPRLDNLTSVYASLHALVGSNSQNICICACFDNEETGSSTRQGGNSAFLGNVIDLIAESLGFTAYQKASAKENGFVLSVDNGHAVHPAHPEKSDITNKVYMGEGIVVKHHVNYATDGCSSAVFKNILQQNGIAFQDYYNRSDLHCGSTIGCMVATKLTMRTVDIGLAQLAMHSACETIATADVETMQKGITAFFNAEKY